MAILYCRRTGVELQEALARVQADSAQRLHVMGLSPAMAG